MADPATYHHAPSDTLELPVDTETLRRLLGQGCIDCGTSGQLVSVGYRYTIGHNGGRLGWPVLACPEHWGAQ